MEVTQERVNRFADATDDHQWIHVDEERAKDGPFGGTIAHGYLTLSLIPHFNQQLLDDARPSGPRLNYGLNKVRFPDPVTCRRPDPLHRHADSTHRHPGRQADDHPLHPSRSRARPKPACVAEMVALLLPQLRRTG